ncbi:unnamed protein product [Rotaria socialis]|uniref:Uncharacterized protein n=1 Tax=Rotaria socialis TaxID=392032 RepID=A0A818ZBK2_9BILA|nr:unnamed protein product [Rotaria socialis]
MYTRQVLKLHNRIEWNKNAEEQVITQTTSNPKVKRKIVIHIISAIIIPVLIVIATIIVSIQQNELNKTNRDNDLEIAQKQCKHDLYISNQTREQYRELSTLQRQQEQFLADQQRQESLVGNYIREISELLLSVNFTLTNKIRENIIRPQTLAVLRQLDGKMKTYAILFLCESTLLIDGKHSV